MLGRPTMQAPKPERKSSVDESLERADAALYELHSEQLSDMGQLDYLRRQAQENNFSRNFLALIAEDR
jgi:hypothetical protein